MANNKDVSLKAKLSVDLNTFKDFENKVKSLSKTFKNVQIEIASSSQGMDKTIQQAFFGKRGTDRTTIKGFFKKQFKGIIDAFTAEIRAASKAMVDMAGTTSAQSISDMIKVLTKQEKEIEKLTNQSKKNIKKTASHPVYGKLTKEQYGSLRDSNAMVSREKEEKAYLKQLDEYNKTLVKIIDSEKVKGELTKEQAKIQRKIAKQVAKVPYAAFNPREINKNILHQGTSYESDMADMKSFYTKQAGDALKERIKLNVRAANISRGLDDNEFKRKQKIEKAQTKLHGEELLAQLKQEQMLYAEKKRLEAEKLENAKNVIRQATGWGDGGGWLGGIKDAPVKSFFDGIIKGAGGMKGAIESAIGKLKELVKYLAIVGAAGIGGFIALGAVVQKLAAGVLFATEKMRGYEIALFGMMKTQDGVNELMEKAFKVTKNLPISYEQVYQSTKAFTLIGPVRDMLKNVGETETVLKRMYSITMALSQIEPEWGLAGAQFSLREALSGDLRSLQRRFEIPVNLIYSKDGRSLRELKNDPEAMSQALSDYFKEFYNEETLGMAANQFGAILGKIEGKWFEFQSAIGNAGFYDLFVGELKEVRDELEAFAGSAEFKDVTNRISNSLGSSLNSLLSIIEKLVVGFGSLFGINVQATNAFQSAVDVVEKFAAVLRIIDRIITEVDIFGYLNKTLEATKKIALDVGNYLLRMFRSIRKDINMLVSVIEKFTGVKDLFGDRTGKGLFYLWLFGPSNLFAMVSGFGTSLVAVIYTIKS
ncbi:hypothetical protein, partial [Methanoculleus sp.]|uniref:hypothetical protein n=1 Tax=Methanoculleus sp. TaxID=90427 RepID=UPI0025FBEBFA